MSIKRIEACFSVGQDDKQVKKDHLKGENTS